MAERVLKCPQCNAPLAPSRFARSVVCPFCGSTVLIDEQAVQSARFRAAFKAWNAPENHGFASWISIGDSHWAVGPLIARGEISDVHAAQRARWPSERALLKILRDPGGEAGFRHEWEVLVNLQEREGAASLAPRLPQPVLYGAVTGGSLPGAKVMVLRWEDGFVHTFEDVRRAYPRGIDPRPSIWIWRRILELLAFLHYTSGFIHGAVLPPHLLIQNGEHGVRLVGFRCANLPGLPLRDVDSRFASFYPRELLAGRTLTAATDLAMSARCVAVLLGGDAASGEVPGAVPAPLAHEIHRVSSLREASLSDAWELRESLGELARKVFGPPAFCPLIMPEEA